MSVYRREVRIGDSLLLRKANSSWIRIDILSVDGERIQIGVDAPIDYPSRHDGQDLLIGPIRLFFLRRVGTQKFQFGIRSPRHFSVVRSGRGAPNARPSKMRTAQDVREKLGFIQQRLAVEEGEVSSSASSTQIEVATDDKLRLVGAVDALRWVLGEVWH